MTVPPTVTSTSTVPDPNRWTLVVAIDSVGAAATVLRADGSQELLTVEGASRIASVVTVDEGGLLLAGPAGARRAADRPAWSLRDPMRRLESNAPVVLGASRHAPTEVVATIIRFFARLGAARLGRPAAAVRLSCPDGWNADERHRLEMAAAAAGFTSCEVVDASAAALAAARAAGAPRVATVLHEIGAADITLAFRDTDGAVLGSPTRLADWGVELVDERLVDAIGARLDPAMWQQLESSDAPAWLAAGTELRRAAHGARVQLSATGVDAGATAAVAFETPDGSVSETIRRFEVASIVAELVGGTADTLRMLLGDRGVGLDAVVRVCGEPLAGVDEALRAALPMATVIAEHPDVAVAYGVALVGAEAAVEAAVEPIVEPTIAMPTAAAPTQVIELPKNPTPEPAPIAAPLAVNAPEPDRGKGLLVGIAAVLAFVALGLGGYAWASTRGGEGQTEEIAAEETAAEGSTSTTGETTTTTEPTTTEPTTTEPTTTTTEAPTTTVVALESVLLDDADLPGWSAEPFSVDDEVSICGLAPVAQPLEVEGRAWSTPTPSGEATWNIANWVERYDSAETVAAVYDRDANLPDECLDTSVEIGGVMFDATFETNVTDFDQLGAGDIVVLSGVLIEPNTGLQVNLLSAAQVWGRHYTIVQLFSAEPLADDVVGQYVDLIQEAFDRATILER